MCPPDDVHRPSDGKLRLIERYESIAAASRAMLVAAQEGDMDELSRLEDRCRELIAELKASDSERLSDHEQKRRIDLLREILRADAAIRIRSEPWLALLEQGPWWFHGSCAALVCQIERTPHFGPRDFRTPVVSVSRPSMGRSLGQA